jgi:hypothetical protein
MFLLAETPSIAGLSWSVIFMIISLILLFFAAFVSGGIVFRGDAAWTTRGVGVGWAGMFFFVLALAVR